jgi:hypothetical protein
LSRNYRIVTDRRKGQSAFGGLRITRRTPTRAAPDTILSRLPEQKTPPCELHYFDAARVALLVSGELD